MGDQVGVGAREGRLEGPIDGEDRHGDVVGVEDVDRAVVGALEIEWIDLLGFDHAADHPDPAQEVQGLARGVGVEADDGGGDDAEEVLEHGLPLRVLGEDPIGLPGSPPGLFVDVDPGRRGDEVGVDVLADRIDRRQATVGARVGQGGEGLRRERHQGGRRGVGQGLGEASDRVVGVDVERAVDEMGER